MMLPFDSDAGGAPAPQAPWTVGQTNERARRLLEGSLGQVAVAGELADVRPGRAGYVWFTLKDREASLSAVYFGRKGGGGAALLAGEQVVVHGRLSIYRPSGRFQLIAQAVLPQGQGALQAAFEALKARLRAQGLFAAERKRPLALLPGRVAVVTSPTGAVVRDIIHVALRRMPTAHITVVPAVVQGAECARAVAADLATAAALQPPPSVIIVARGGGSLADLWGFNEEQVVRAIAASPVPVVSAVGHETDITLADLVADLRAPTPSAAAELVFPEAEGLGDQLRLLRLRQRRALLRWLERARLRLEGRRSRLGDGRRCLQLPRQRLAELQRLAEQRLARLVSQRRRQLNAQRSRLSAQHPRVHLARHRGGLRLLMRRLQQQPSSLIAHRRQALVALMQRLRDLSPMTTLGRGYAIVLGADGVAVRDAGQAAVGQPLAVRLHRGQLAVTVTQVETGG